MPYYYTQYFQTMFTFEDACEESMKQRRQRKIDNGNLFYSSVSSLPRKAVGWFIPLWQTSSSTGPIKLQLYVDEIFTVGRDVDCSFTFGEKMFKDEENLEYNKASRVHFSLSLDDGHLILTNNSMNGTFVNGVSVENKCLCSGDKISILHKDLEIFRWEE